jgi:hypothetical protein
MGIINKKKKSWQGFSGGGNANSNTCYGNNMQILQKLKVEFQ